MSRVSRKTTHSWIWTKYSATKQLALILALQTALIGTANELPVFSFRHYSTEHGLPSNCVRDIAQDDDGFVWFATDGGLVRFDGRDFKPYPLSDNDNDIHDDNYVMALHTDDRGLWVGTDAHLFHYDSYGDRLEYIPFTLEDGTDEPLNIRTITSDRDGNIWMSVVGKGVCRMDCHSGEYAFTVYPFPQTNNFVGEVYVDSQNDVWTVSNQNKAGIYRLDKNANAFREFHIKENGQTLQTSSLSITEDDSNTMWIGDWKGSIIGFDPYTGDCYSLTPCNSQPLLHIHTLLPQSDGTMLIGSDSGLAVFNIKTKQMNLFKHEELDAESLSDQFVYPIKRDREGGLWVGTYYGGVNYSSPDLKRFEKHQASKYSNSVSGNVIAAFAEDAHGNIYIASDDGGLSLWNHASKRFKHIALNQSERDNVHALMIDNDYLWIGTYSDGLYVLDTSTGNLCHYELGEGYNSSYAMLKDRDGILWIAAESNLRCYDSESDEIRQVKNLEAQIVSIKQDAAGMIWVATQGQGLHCYDPTTNAWRAYRYSSVNGSLPHNHVNAIEFDTNGTLWVATVDGVSRYHANKHSFSTPQRLHMVGSAQSLVADQGNLWIATQLGLVKYNPVSEDIEVYTRADGLCSIQFQVNSMLKASNGKIYVGTRSGFNAFMPYQIKPNSHIPRVMFTRLEINNATVETGDEHLPCNINNLECLKLYPNDNSFGISFASLSYVSPEKNQYIYKLEGFDKDWISVGDRNKAFYTNLPSGTYRLLVKGSNSDNLWTEEASVLNIEIRPPWYSTWYMKSLYVLALIGTLGAAFLLYSRRSEEKHKVELRRIKHEKDIDVYQAKLSFFTMVAHEIRTPVTLIMGPLEKLMKSTDKMDAAASKQLATIERNSQRLIFLVNQLLDFRKVEDSDMNIVYRHCPVAPLINGVVDRFRPTLEHKGVRLDENIAIPDDFVADIDAEAVTKLISNLMNNARKFTHDYIGVTVTAEKDTFTIKVCDNGIGISKENQAKIFRPFYQVNQDNAPNPTGTGLGLSIVQKVAEAHGGKVELESELKKGSCFSVTLPTHHIDVEDLPENTNQQEELQPVETEDNPERKLKMLVVDDNDELCHFIANNFNDRYEVITAADGEEATRLLARNNVSLIISDWMMPKMDGVELCQYVRGNRDISHIPFILLTAKTDNMSKVEGFNCGADAYVEKPFSVQVLEARIDNLLHMRKLLRHKYSQTPLESIESVAAHPMDNEFLTELTAIIEKNFSNPDLDVDYLAGEMNMSRSTLYNKIRSLVDVTPNDLIRITRLKQAAKLLADGRYRVNEICFMVGFNSSSYFSKCFQKQFGMTPTEFITSTVKGVQ